MAFERSTKDQRAREEQEKMRTKGLEIEEKRRKQGVGMVRG